MSKRKIYVVKSSMCRKEKNHFDWWEVYGVFTSMKLVNEVLEQAYRINKGTDLVIDGNNPLMRTYSCLSTDGHECYVRNITEIHILNKGW